MKLFDRGILLQLKIYVSLAGLELFFPALTSEKSLDKYIGKPGTPEREQYEFELSMEILGAKLKRIRIERNLTQEQLGKLLGCRKRRFKT